jgi:hypothetical protein
MIPPGFVSQTSERKANSGVSQWTKRNHSEWFGYGCFGQNDGFCFVPD